MNCGNAEMLGCRETRLARQEELSSAADTMPTMPKIPFARPVQTRVAATPAAQHPGTGSTAAATLSGPERTQGDHGLHGRVIPAGHRHGAAEEGPVIR